MDNTEVVYLYLDDIIPNRFQPREVFDEQGLKELAVSIKEHGVIQPIIVRQVDNKYEIIAGERRYKASTMAGLTKIPAIVKNLDDKESSKVALIENLQRRDLSPIEEARTYQKILELEDNMTQEELAASVGKTQSSVSNKIRLLSLPDEVQDALLNNKISERHARCLLKIESADEQVKMLSRITEEKLTVRELDRIIKEKDKPKEENEVEEIIPDNDNETPVVNETSGPGIPAVDENPPEETKEEEADTPVVNEVIEDAPKEEPQDALNEKPQEETPAPEENKVDISNIANPFARKEVDEPMDQNNNPNNNLVPPMNPGGNMAITPPMPQAPTNMVPQMVPQVQMQNPQQMPSPMQPQMVPQAQQPQVMPQKVQLAPGGAPQMPQAPQVAGPQAPVAAQMPQAQMVSAPAGGTDSKSITEAINKLVEEYKSKGANIDFRSYNIGTVTSISITIR